MAEGHHCSVLGAEARPGSHGGLSQRHDDSGGEKEGYYGDAVALDCSCHGSAAVQVESRDQGWLEALSSGHFGKFDGRRVLHRGGSSAQRGYRLDKSK